MPKKYVQPGYWWGFYQNRPDELPIQIRNGIERGLAASDPSWKRHSVEYKQNRVNETAAFYWKEFELDNGSFIGTEGEL